MDSSLSLCMALPLEPPSCVLLLLLLLHFNHSVAPNLALYRDRICELLYETRGFGRCRSLLRPFLRHALGRALWRLSNVAVRTFLIRRLTQPSQAQGPCLRCLRWHSW